MTEKNFYLNLIKIQNEKYVRRGTKDHCIVICLNNSQ